MESIRNYCRKPFLVFCLFSVIAVSYVFLILYGNYISAYQSHCDPIERKENTIVSNNRSLFHARDKQITDKELTSLYVKNISSLFNFKEANCSRLISGDQTYTQNVEKIVPTVKGSLSDEDYMSLTEDCETFKKTRGYIMSSLTEEEKEFPIAYSIMTFKNSEMVERLLRSIYRPQNYYCIHVDMKSSDSFLLAVSAISKCFANVFLTSTRRKVYWGTYTVLEPELFCLKELWRYRKWKYFINLTGQEFPLKTNFELVKILKAYNGANNIEGVVKRVNEERWNNRPPPFGLRPVKGAIHVTISRSFVDYVLHNKTAQAVLNWSTTIGVPDEGFFPTLNFNPQLGVKGTYSGDPDEMKDYLTRYKIWYGGHDQCAGSSVRGVCIQSTGDLYRLGQAKHLFANKFYLEEDRVVIGCLEEKLFNDTRDEYLGTKTFNESYYANLDFVKYQII
ncbi:unnamed protein product [Lymnaea stagnalis]|uniref:Beta-1,3-galactosyl-O-glycosyl-glycoprotein beta-1,6-N-acetylglucosaminyltransferase n=1 Tax=Lymnaea stagnalis TaxID=6523 RepID=A0AAV2HJI6_LYMST